MRDRFGEAIGPHGVTPSEWAILAAVGRGGCTNAAEVCEATGRDKAGVARTVAALVRSGLIVRSSGIDARTKTLALSAEAAAAMPLLEACSRQVNRQVLALLRPDERRTLLTLLERLTTEIDKSRSPKGPS